MCGVQRQHDHVATLSHLGGSAAVLSPRFDEIICDVAPQIVDNQVATLSEKTCRDGMPHHSQPHDADPVHRSMRRRRIRWSDICRLLCSVLAQLRFRQAISAVGKAKDHFARGCWVGRDVHCGDSVVQARSYG